MGKGDTFLRCLSCRKKIFTLNESGSFCLACISPEKTTENVCLTCGKSFITLNKKQKWCCQKCCNKYIRSEDDKVSMSRRWDVFVRDCFKCKYCGKSPEDGKVLHIDHIKPKILGGSNKIDNLITACQECNIGKSDKELTGAALTEILTRVKTNQECLRH
jgi:5-methylcytosine-specific restriction endonuclease McrA